jgi:hypothetical protein
LLRFADLLQTRRLDPDRLRDVLAIHLDRREDRDDCRREHSAELTNRSTAAEAPL